MVIKNWQSRKTGNTRHTIRRKTTKQYVLDTTMRKQTQTTSIRYYITCCTFVNLVIHVSVSMVDYLIILQEIDIMSLMRTVI